MSIPIGPVALLCIKKTIDYGRSIGFISGLGSATADMIYAIIVSFGLTFVSNFFIEYQVYLQAIGALFLLSLGVKSLRQQTESPTRLIDDSRFKDFMATFFLALSNPFTLLVIITLLANLGIAYFNTTLWNNIAVPLGILAGEFTWWAILVTISDHVERRWGSRIIPIVNKISGITLILLACGIALRILLL